MSDLRANHPVMRIRCEADDGTEDHYAVDIEQPVSIGRNTPLTLLTKLTKCACGKAMVASFGPRRTP